MLCVRGMGITANAEIGAVEPERIPEAASDQFADADVELLFVSCTNFRALKARQLIEQDLELPVVTSNHAALECVIGELPIHVTSAGA